MSNAISFRGKDGRDEVSCSQTDAFMLPRPFADEVAVVAAEKVNSHKRRY